MFDFTFSLVDIPKVLLVIFLECALSADNALVLASLIHHLPTKKQKTKALWVGSVSSLILRGLAILFIVVVIKFTWIQVIGALYLIYLSLSHYLKPTSPSQGSQIAPPSNFWLTVLKIECFDCLFAVDSILAALAVVGINQANAHNHSKLWIVYLGGIAGVIAIRFTASFFSKVLSKHPPVQGVTHLVLGWIGLKMLVDSLLYYLVPPTSNLAFIHHIVEGTFWVGLIGLCLFTFFLFKKK